MGKRVVDQPQKMVCYVRVSSQAQKPDLVNQQRVLEEFCQQRGYVVDEWIKEIGGGMNFKRRKFLSLMDEVLSGHIQRVVMAHKDRLARFGSELISHLFRRYGCELVILNSESLSPEQELVQDLMSITHCFSRRLSGLRNYRKSLKEALKRDAASA
jgi:predicted site-specific integrase-resolvase